MTISPVQINSARERLGWSKSQLAAKIGLPAETIEIIETGTCRPTALAISTIRQILEDAGVDFMSGSQSGARLRAQPERTNG